jgi:hypothetical protein
MLDSKIRPWIEGPLNWAGEILAKRGISAHVVTLFGLFMGLLAAGMLAVGLPGGLALVPLLIGLLAAFYINGASFLGYAIMAEKRGIETQAQGEKSLYYSAGLLEGAETIGFFVILCLWPAAFGPLAVIFGVLCFLTTGARIALARRVFS